MLDASAFELADFDWASRNDRRSGPPKAHAEGSEDLDVAALAGCAACQQAIGDCAVHYANSGIISPTMALSICSSMQRLTRRAFEARAATLSGYAAYVLLGPAPVTASRQSDLEALAETMR